MGAEGRRGRPRTFDRTQALRRAMEAFWERGYEGVGVAELTATMGISAPSMYAAFGSKEELFRDAVALYSQAEGGVTERAMHDAATARSAIEEMLRGNAQMYADPKTPAGCMVVLAATNSSRRSEAVRQFLVDERTRVRNVVDARLAAAVEAGELPPTCDTQGVADFYDTVNNGVALRAGDGASESTLRHIVDRAIGLWPHVVGLDGTSA